MSGNPIKLVRQSAKRERTPDILELAELQLLFTNLSVRERTVALLDAATGLRVSETACASLVRCRFRELGTSCDAIYLASSSGQLQNGSLSQAPSDGRLHGGGSFAMALPECLHVR